MDARDRYELEQEGLRKLFRDFSIEGVNIDRNTNMSFCNVYNPMFGTFHMWDEVPKMTIATIGITPKRVLLRINPVTEWKHQISKFKMGDRKIISIETPNVIRHDAWIRGRVGNRCANAIRRIEESFLAPLDVPQSAEDGSLFRLNIPTMQYQEVFSTRERIMSPTHEMVTVLFGATPTNEEQNNALRIIRDFNQAETRLSGEIPYNDLVRYDRDQRRQRELERDMARQTERAFGRMNTGISELVESNSALRRQQAFYQQEYTRAYEASPTTVAMNASTYRELIGWEASNIIGGNNENREL